MPVDLRGWAAECRAYARLCGEHEREAVTELAEAFEATADAADAKCKPITDESPRRQTE
jgi:hypothetical protein